MFLVYNNALKTLQAYETNGKLVKEWRATNYAQSSSAGIWPVGVFQFDKLIASPPGSTINSSYGKEGKLQFSGVPYYEKLGQSVVVPGQATFTTDNDTTGFRSGMQIHSGKADSQFGDGNHPTNGCIRVTATVMKELVSLFGKSGISDLMVSHTPVASVLVNAPGTSGNDLIRTTSGVTISAGGGSDVIIASGATGFTFQEMRASTHSLAGARETVSQEALMPTSSGDWAVAIRSIVGACSMRPDPEISRQVEQEPIRFLGAGEPIFYMAEMGWTRSRVAVVLISSVEMVLTGTMTR